MYQLVIFDWDGTLMDSAAKISTCMREAAREAGLIVPSVEAAKGIIGLGLMEAASVLYPHANDTDKRALIEAYRYQFLHADKTEQQFFVGVEQGLQRLSDLGVFLAVATGKSRAGLDRALENSGFGRYFTITRCADETRSKPHPQMLHEILDYTAIDTNKTIMVGDTSFDLDMARAANVDGLGAAYGVHSVDVLQDSGAVAIKHSFTDLLEWLLDQRVEKAFR